MTSIIFILCISLSIGIVESGPTFVVGPPACSRNISPPEFFTCVDRAPGKYADDKRDCFFYWQCGKNGSIDHVPCSPPGTVFDDRLKKCVANRTSCPVNYGDFRSGGSVCRGRPYKNIQFSPSERQPVAQAYYPYRLVDCVSYFWCFIADNRTYGYRFDCPSGLIFDEKTQSCQKSSNAVKCNCGNWSDVV